MRQMGRDVPEAEHAWLVGSASGGAGASAKPGAGAAGATMVDRQ